MSIQRSTAPSRREQLAALQERAGMVFRDSALLDQALTHSSYVNECPEERIDDNQRLEFLGDAILDFLVGEWLFQRYPDAREGELTSIRADVVRTTGLALFAREIGLGQYLLMGRGEAANGGSERAGNLCAAFEALVGAIYLDQAIAHTSQWIQQFLDHHSQAIDEKRSAKDSKTCFQEYTQAHFHITPAYRIIEEQGPDHAKTFTAQVLVGQDIWGEGTGKSKQIAEATAAAAALGRVSNLP